jgi:23S rRNA (uracil1939-C5)-methyltransferase
MKRDILRESLKRAHLRVILEIAAITAAPFGYRNRIRLHVQKNPFALCYNVRNSHVNLPIEDCPIAAPLLQHAIRVLSREGEDLGLGNFVTEIELFAAPDDSSLLLSLWGSRLRRETLDNLSHSLRQILPEVSGVGSFVAGNRALSELAAFAGSDSLIYPAGNRHYHVSFGSFFQVNRFLIDSLVELVTRSEKGDLAWDLYAGVGLFSLPLSESFSSITAVESAPSAVRDLRENLRGAKHHIVAADTRAFLRQMHQQRTPAPDLVVVDPPRTGLGLDAAATLAKIRPRKITYVSCDPATLGRDLAVLVESGYRLDKMDLLDLFPQTFHLESVTHLTLD